MGNQFNSGGNVTMEKRPAPGWMSKGLRAVLNHEPVFFLRRRGGWFADADAVRDVSYGEESVRKLAAAGIDIYVVHGYKGFGLEFEKKEHWRLRKLREYCTRHGVRLGTYCQVATIVLATMRPDYPDSPNWIQRDAHGRPNYYGWQTYRNLPCFHSEGFREYYRGVIRYIAEDIGTDLFHFDNLIDQREPYACRCERCAAAFTEHLVSKYPDPAMAEERFGYADVGIIEPPVYHPECDPQDVPVVVDPVVQEWEEFRCLTMKGFLEEISDYVWSLNPEIGVEINSGSIPDMNRYRSCATYWPYLARHTDIIYNESSGQMPRVNANGVLGSNIRGYKMGWTLGVGVWGGGNYNDEAHVRKTIAERLAFSPDFYFTPYAFDTYADVYERWNRFHADNESLYHGKEQIRDVAALRSVYTHRADSLRSRLSALVAEQALIESGLPFCIGFDDLLDDLDGVRVLVLADQECLSDAQCERITRYVERGGGLVMTGDTSRYDEWRRVRFQWGLGALFGWRKRAMNEVAPSPGDGAYVRLAKQGPECARREVGAGRAVYIPTILPAELPAIERKLITQEHWALPENVSEFLDAILWASGGRVSARVHAPLHCCAEFTRDTRTGKRVFHVVNFNIGEGARQVRIEINENPPAALRLRSIEVEGESALRPVDRAAGVFEIPEVADYCVVFEP